MADKEKREVGDALGLVETRGLIGMIEAADVMVKTANDDHRPEWKSDSFFRRYAGGQ